jgi:hypothetical protein
MKLWGCYFGTSEDEEFIGEKFHENIISENLLLGN